jgi:hypothetical protein
MGAKRVSTEEAAFIARMFQHRKLADVVRLVNEQFGVCRSLNGMKQYAKKHQIKSGRTGRIERGTPAWNKGKKGVNGKSSTTFKVGNFPHQTLPMYSERITKDGLIEIKVKERGKTFVSKHRWLWEQKNGPVPRGHIIRFKDGDNRNFADGNLICVSRHLNMALNQSNHLAVPQPLRETHFLTQKLSVTAKERARD